MTKEARTKVPSRNAIPDMGKRFSRGTQVVGSTGSDDYTIREAKDDVFEATNPRIWEANFTVHLAYCEDTGRPKVECDCPTCEEWRDGPATIPSMPAMPHATPTPMLPPPPVAPAIECAERYYGTSCTNTQCRYESHRLPRRR